MSRNVAVVLLVLGLAAGACSTGHAGGGGPPAPFAACHADDQVRLLELRRQSASEDWLIGELRLGQGVSTSSTALIIPYGKVVTESACFVRGTGQPEWMLTSVPSNNDLYFESVQNIRRPDGVVTMNWGVGKRVAANQYDVVWELYLRTADGR